MHTTFLHHQNFTHPRSRKINLKETREFLDDKSILEVQFHTKILLFHCVLHFYKRKCILIHFCLCSLKEAKKLIRHRRCRILYILFLEICIKLITLPSGPCSVILIKWLHGPTVVMWNPTINRSLCLQLCTFLFSNSMHMAKLFFFYWNCLILEGEYASFRIFC